MAKFIPRRLFNDLPTRSPRNNIARNMLWKFLILMRPSKLTYFPNHQMNLNNEMTENLLNLKDCLNVWKESHFKWEYFERYFVVATHWHWIPLVLRRAQTEGHLWYWWRRCRSQLQGARSHQVHRSRWRYRRTQNYRTRIDEARIDLVKDNAIDWWRIKPAFQTSPTYIQ